MMTKEERDEIFRRALAGCRPKAPPPKPAPPPAYVVAQERWAQPKPREAIAAQAAVSTKALAEQMRQDRQETGDDREYWRVLHAQIDNGGAEAMLYNLGKQWLEGWHPRDIPEAFLTNPALQKQKTYNLPPWEQWYVGLLHNGRLPNAPSARPNRSFTRDLFADARAKVPRLHYASEVELRNFLIDEERIGIACTKFRASSGNGWTFPPLAECREAWCKRWGPTKFDAPDVEDWISLLDEKNVD